MNLSAEKISGPAYPVYRLGERTYSLVPFSEELNESSLVIGAYYANYSCDVESHADFGASRAGSYTVMLSYGDNTQTAVIDAYSLEVGKKSYLPNESVTIYVGRIPAMRAGTIQFPLRYCIPFLRTIPKTSSRRPRKKMSPLRTSESKSQACAQRTKSTNQ